MIYKNGYTYLGDLLKDIQSGRLGLPDLQRPFVWQNNKIKNLYDSLMKGYPIGYIMIWQAPGDYTKTRYIGTDEKNHPTIQDIVIDGQQRLTALYATMYGIEVVDKDYKHSRKKISYNPLTRELDNWSASKDKDKNFIPDVSEVFKADREKYLPKFVNDYIAGLNESRAKKNEEPVSDKEIGEIDSGIRDLLNILNYQIATINITNEADEKDVADIFVRVNSGGQPLTQDDFISTLLSVYDADVRKKIEDFCVDSRIPKEKDSAYNALVSVDTGDIIRTTAAIAFKRARLSFVYKLMRGTDLSTNKKSQETLEENLAKFRESLELVLNLNNWHAFLLIVKSVGFVTSKLISSPITIFYSYALYLIAKTEFGLSNEELRKVFKPWFFAAALSSYYVEKSPETAAEQQLTNIKDMKNKQEFIDYMNKKTKERMTDDFFNVKFKNALDERNAMGPIWTGYVASQIILGYKTLFSTNSIETMLLLGASGTKKIYDVHHIFPKNFLQKNGYTEKDYDKRANFTILDYETNIDISDDAPEKYVKRYKEKTEPNIFNSTMAQNAVPLDITELSYEKFIEDRKKLMVKIVKAAYESIKPE